MKKINPPYAPVGWLSKAFDTFNSVKLNKVDKKTIRTYDLTSPGNESKMLAALRFLGIIDEKNNTNMQRYNALSFSGDRKKEELSKIVRTSYSRLFETIPDLEKAEFDILKNFFISEYEYSGVLAEASVKAFAFFCKEAGMPLSEDILKKTDIKRRKRKSKEKVKKKIKKDTFPKKYFEQEGFPHNAVISFNPKDSLGINFPIDSIAEWEDAKDFIDIKIRRMFNNQGPHVQTGAPEKEDTSLYDESDKTEDA